MRPDPRKPSDELSRVRDGVKMRSRKIGNRWQVYWIDTATGKEVDPPAKQPPHEWPLS